GSRAWINGRPATLSQLGTLAGFLVEIHGQHEHQALLSRSSQLTLLDAYGRHARELDAVASAAQQWVTLERERDALSQAGDPAERRDWLRHQLDELAGEALEDGAIETLLANHRRHAHAAELIQACDTALERIGDDQAL